MDKSLFLKLYEGYNTDNLDEIKYLDNLVKADIVKIKEAHYILDSKYKIGTLVFQKNFATLSDISSEHKTLKLEFENLNGALDGDLVIVKRVFNPRRQSQSKVIKIITSKSEPILVYVKNHELYTVKESILIKNKIPQEVEQDDVFLYNNKEDKIIEFFGNLNDAKIDEKISLFLYTELYRTNTFEDINPQDYDLNDFNSRIDLRHLPFCTIDPSTAKDHDDAIYYDEKEQTLYVAIADVSYFVKENSALNKLAMKKATSLYLPHKVLPMLPPSLSEELCSLKENTVRFAYVFKIVIDIEKIEVKHSEYFEAVIKSHKNLSYGRVDRVLQGKLDQYNEVEKTIFNTLIALYKITQQFRKKRLIKGYEFETHEFRQKLNNMHELESVTTEESTDSHKLVEECMLLANVEASKKVNTVAIYRVHEEPTFEAISKLVDLVNTLGVKVKMQGNVHDTILGIQQKAKSSMFAREIDELIIQSQVQAHYNSTNLGHFGLGFESYSHFTSPIRRYSDLVLHRILKTKQTPENIDDTCTHISNTQRKVDQLVWDFEERKYARWASKHINEEFKARITDAQKGIAKFYEQMPGLKVVLDNFKGQLLFSKIKVTIKEVNIVSKTIVATIKY
ncbi:MAG: ribonuclease R family protein [Arcobacteraceae bacterium]